MRIDDPREFRATLSCRRERDLNPVSAPVATNNTEGRAARAGNAPKRLQWLIIAVTWTIAALAVSPVLLRWTAGRPSAFRTHVAIDLSYVAAAILCYAFFRVESTRLERSRAIALVAMIFLLASVTNQIHSFNVDQASNYAPPLANAALQEYLQEEVVHLSPAVVPHSYRFLPNALVYWLQLAGVRFDAARDIYRLLTGLLIFYALYRFARLYTDLLGGIITLLLTVAIYPISFEWYIGQLTDPLSQLSFVLAFIFLETENFACLLTTLLLGSLAKETVLALCGFYVLSCRSTAHYRVKAVVLCTASLAMFLCVRLFVLHGGMHYEQISGPGPAHVFENWRDIKWQRLILLTAGAYLPFLVLAWKRTPVSLKHLVFYLFPVLFLSSWFFSWLSEARNWMPIVFVLAVIAARYWDTPSGSSSAANTSRSRV